MTAGGDDSRSRIISVNAPISKSQLAPEIFSSCPSLSTLSSQSRRSQAFAVSFVLISGFAIWTSFNHSVRFSGIAPSDHTVAEGFRHTQHTILVFHLFPIELQPFHHRSIIDGKENRLFIGKILVRMPLPKRYDERISLLPFEMAFPYRSPASSFENVIEGRAGMAMHPGFLFGFKKLNLTRHRRVGKSSRCRIDITQQRTIVWVAGAVAHSLEGFVGILPRVAEGNPTPVVLVFLGCARKTETTKGFPDLAGNRLFIFFVVLKKQNVQRLDQRSIQSIQPDNRVFGFVVMIMPGPIRRED